MGRVPPFHPCAFGREARLRKRAEFTLVYDEGRRIGGRYFTCFFRRTGDEMARNGSAAESGAPPSPPRLGITVTRKTGKAAVRNRLRRVAREFFRLRRCEMRGGFDVVVNGRAEAVDQPAKTLWSDLETIFKRAGVINSKPRMDTNTH